MKGLSVNSFWTLRPKMPFRYKTQFFTGLGINEAILSFTVTSINLPKMEGQASEGSIYFGNTIYTIPVWNIASRKLEISFEETDEMNVTKFLDALNNKSYGKAPWKITIIISEYDEKFNNELSTAYICHLISYDEPSFKRDGSAQQVTMSASFIVDTIINNWSEGMATYTGQTEMKTNEELNPPLDNLINDVQNEKFTFGDKGGNTGGIEPAKGKLGSDKKGYHNDKDYKGVDDDLVNSTGAKATDKDITGDEAKIRQFMREAGMDDKEITRQLEFAKKDGVKDEFQLKNMEALAKNLAAANKQLKAKGITMFENCFVTGEHVDSENVATHGAGSKADMGFRRADGTKIDYNTATAEEINLIQSILNQNGLFMQFEGHSQYGDESGWGDVVLNVSYTKSGKVINDRANRKSIGNGWGNNMTYKAG